MAWSRSDTPSWRRRRSIPAWRSAPSATSRARWSGSASTWRGNRGPPDHGRMARPPDRSPIAVRGAPTSFAPMGRLGARQRRSCQPRPVEGDVGDRDLPHRPRSAAMSSAVRTARTRASPTIPAATATVRSVRARRRGNGSRNARPSSCRSPTITSSSPYRRRSAPSRSRTRPSPTISCSGLRPRL